MSDEHRMSYRYIATFQVVIEADGQHADGDGAMATIRRLHQLLASDPRVVERGVQPHPTYIGTAKELEERRRA